MMAYISKASDISVFCTYNISSLLCNLHSTAPASVTSIVIGRRDNICDYIDTC